MAKRTSLRAAMATALLLAAAAAVAPAPAAGDERPQAATGPALTVEALRQRVVGNTMYRSGRTLGVEWHWAGYFRGDGRMRGRAWWGFGDIEGRGTWRIEDGRWCQFWTNVDWSEGGTNCYRIYPVGEQLFWDHVAGPHVEDWLFAVRRGNAFDLRFQAEAGEARPRP